MTRIDQIAGGIYRISTIPKDSPVGFNQFLIDDEQPALIHTGMAPMYEDVCKAIGQVLDPSRLAYIILLHFEGDECGGMERFMAQAPHARLVGCELSASLNLNSFDFACQGRVTGKRDGEAISLGRHTLRFLETPEAARALARGPDTAALNTKGPTNPCAPRSPHDQAAMRRALRRRAAPQHLPAPAADLQRYPRTTATPSRAAVSCAAFRSGACRDRKS